MDNQGQKNMPSGSIPGIILFFILLFVFAKWGPAINFSTLSQAKGEPFVVTGTGKISVAPDEAKVDFGIQEQGASLKQIQDSANKKSKTLTDALKKLGITDADIKTTSYSVGPQYDYSGGTPRITGYQISINYEVTVKNFDILNQVFTVATGNGANLAGGVNFDLSDSLKKQKTQEARDEAVKEAKDEANGLSKSAGITLGKIINVSEQQQNAPRPFAALDKSVSVGLGGAPNAAPEPVVNPGTTDVTVTVSLSYEVR